MGGPKRDWGSGLYESTAQRLLPAARVLVDIAAPRPGERLLDLGSGTGSVALIAAALGAQVTAVDPSRRLLGVASQAAEQRGLSLRCEVGEASDVPAPDGCFDCVLSNFGMIFSRDAAAAVAELARVLDVTGRAAFTAPLPGGATSAMNATAHELVRSLLPEPLGPAGFPWHDQSCVRDLFSEYSMTVSAEGPYELAFTAPSPAAFLEEQSTQHPMMLGRFQFFHERGVAEDARQQLLQVLTEQNEDPDSFLSTVRYLVFVIRRT